MFPHTIKKLLFVFLCFICSPCLGWELPELITKLEKMEGRDQIHASVHIEDYTSTENDKEAGKLETDFVISAKDGTLAVTYSGEISKIMADPNAGEATFTGEASSARNFQEFSIFRAAELVNYSPSLVRELDGLELKTKKPDKYNDISCTLWILNSKETQKSSGIKATTQRDVEMWIDSEGYPMAASFKTQVTARMMLVFKINSESSRQQHYERVGDRLVLTLDKNQTDMTTDDNSVKRTVTTIVEIKNE